VFFFRQTPVDGRFPEGGLVRSERLFPALCFSAAALLLMAGSARAQSPTSPTSAPPEASSNGKTVSQAADPKLAKAESLMDKGQLDEAEAVVRQNLTTAPD